MVSDDPNVGLAIGLTTAAGLATVIGGGLACLCDPNNHSLLAGCLAMAAGVMVYVSFIEIFPEATNLFHESGTFNSDHAFMMTTLVYFVGNGLCLGADVLTQLWISRKKSKASENREIVSTGEDDDPHGLATAAIAVQELTTGAEPVPAADETRVEGGLSTSSSTRSFESQDELPRPRIHTRTELLGTALFTAGAVCLHNFPEGIVTFIGTLEDPSVGVSLATAIAVHNIPEGIAVASPVLKATGSKKQALFWTLVSALAEPLGGILAWLILGDIINDITIAVMFALTAGVMAYIAIIKLQFSASHFDPTNRWAGGGFLLGTAVMAVSLVLFRLSVALSLHSNVASGDVAPLDEAFRVMFLTKSSFMSRQCSQFLCGSTMVSFDTNVGLAIGLTSAAGFATVIGGGLACLCDPDNHSLLAGCLAIAAGVMVYVSFIEIFPKAMELFSESGTFNVDHAFMMTTLFYFVGNAICLGADILIKLWMSRKERKASRTLEHARTAGDDDACGLAAEIIVVPELAEGSEPPPAESGLRLDIFVDLEFPRMKLTRLANVGNSTALFTAGAVALHTFPEGIVTFLATLGDPAVGVSLAIAIAVHNIPEGIAIATPVLKATGSKKKAVLWTFIAALAEPLGGILAWLILGDIINDITIAVMFALIAGVMAYIAIIKLQFSASQFDPTNHWAGGGFLLGTAVMALSLVLFRI
ncbi:Zinc transporter [Perkinsus olseni]|uniref:Zinc transporter n=2 Tax=Perkinsus olseni TaxID=32597 RepID=A0A7J6N0F5_PEROL|nr:Zinc transporter [Perkinsus olseni]